MNTLSESLVATRQKELNEMQSLRRQVAVRDLELLSEKALAYQGHQLSMTEDAFKALIKLIGMGQQFTKRFGDTFSESAKVQFVNRMKNAMLDRQGEITMVINPNTRKVIGFQPKPTNLISNDRFVDLLTRVQNDGGMEIINWHNNPETGSVNVNMANPHAQFGIKSLDEVFTAGVRMSNSPFGGIEVKPYVNRQWCTNGLVTSHADDTYQLQNLSPDSTQEFFQHLQNLRRNNYIPSEFNESVKRANETPASISELNWAHRQINKYAGDQSDYWIPLKENIDAYGRAGMDVAKFTANESRSAKSNQSIWSLVNGITHMATHGNDILMQGLDGQHQDQLITQAGQLLGREWDHKYAIKDPWKGSGLQSNSQIGSLLN